MSWPELIACVRHAESQGNVLTADERAAFEVPTHGYKLTDRGREQARITGVHLKEAHGAFDVHYTSYYERAKETMRILCPEAKIYEDPRLREAERGIYHSYTRAEVEERFPKELPRKEREGIYHHRPLGGENWPDIELRIHSFLGTLARDCGGKKVLIVVHGHWQMLFEKLIHRTSIEETVRRYAECPIPNASVTAYRSMAHLRRGREGLVRMTEEPFVPWEGKI